MQVKTRKKKSLKVENGFGWNLSYASQHLRRRRSVPSRAEQRVQIKRVREAPRKFSKKLFFFFFLFLFILSIFCFAFLVLGFEKWHWATMSNHHRSSSKNGLPPQELLDDLCRFIIFFFSFLYSRDFPENAGK